MSKIGNIVHDSVPITDDEEFNKVEKQWGEIPKIVVDSTKGKCHHHEVLAMIDGYDPKRGVKVAGHRGYFLKGDGALLNQALIQYGLQFLNKRNYTPVQTPFFMKKSVMSETAQLSDFDDQLYKVTGNAEDEDFYLIATSEQPISAMHRKEWIPEEELPIRYAGSKKCLSFRNVQLFQKGSRRARQGHLGNFQNTSVREDRAVCYYYAREILGNAGGNDQDR